MPGHDKDRDQVALKRKVGAEEVKKKPMCGSPNIEWIITFSDILTYSIKFEDIRPPVCH